MNSSEIRQQLEAQQASLSKRIHGIDSDFRNGRSADFAEQACETENDDVLRSLKLEAEFELRQVNTALSRMKTGDYGTCEKCGEDIGEPRLAALPYTSLCINCSN